jgi:YebC/PmpR family DNA-binding regulatory protein
MSGHSHWAGIKHRKGLNDAKRAQVFTKLAKPIVIAARDGGGNPDTNFRLRLAIEKAREFNMPKDKIDKAIKRGTGELKGEVLEEIFYEATAPGGIMLIIKTTTDNRNRTVSEIKNILLKFEGKMGEEGSIMWNFEQVGNILLDITGKNRDELELLAIDSGAKDTRFQEDVLAVFTDPKELPKVQKNLLEKKLAILNFGLAYIPKTTAASDEKAKINYEKLLETLDEQEDVEEIYDNL